MAVKIMNIDAINDIHQKWNGPSRLHKPAFEATNIDVDEQQEGMKVIITTEKHIHDANLKEVTNPVFFKKGGIPTDDGLFSPIIFGQTPKEKAITHGYIDLKRKFFHPYIFESICRMSKDFSKAAMGTGAWIIKDGSLVEVKDETDPQYDEENTGIGWLVDHFKEISFKETDSGLRKARLKLFNSLTDDELFITKFVVIPIFYRNYETLNGSGSLSIPEINNMYRDLLSNAKSLSNEILSVTKNLTLYRIQKTMVDIRKHGQSLIDHKKGAFQTTILGKATDYGARSVISVPSLNHCEKPDDCIVDILHSGIPLSQCIALGYPFVSKWINEFFEDIFRNKSQVPVYRKGKDGKYSAEYAEIQDPSDYFTKDFIDSKLEMYKNTYGAERFETIKIKLLDGTTTEMLFTGRGYAKDPENPEANTMSTRPLTWTDVIYLACEEMLSDKHVYITRYPLLDYFGTFPTRVSVLSTIKTTPAIVNGKVYPHYPVINLSLPPQQVATQFIDTVSISNLYLDAIGGDYDGDMVSERMVFSLEANEEAEETLKNIKHYLTINGDLARVIGNEAYLTFYNMTRRE